ncbi:MAG: hypothetical protein BMS9Abin36_1182 [Gammaproteobacteria bacterium]|nr:MAG: hypothetical protein BMS9Abin36_1182 [Gammaproteobacteria bacterium]
MGEHTLRVIISATHPSLAGHFPGNPIVPGVVLLDEVIAGLSGFVGKPVEVLAMPHVKFLASVLPEQEFTIEYTTKSEGVVNFLLLLRGEKAVIGSLKFRINLKT